MLSEKERLAILDRAMARERKRYEEVLGDKIDDYIAELRELHLAWRKEEEPYEVEFKGGLDGGHDWEKSQIARKYFFLWVDLQVKHGLRDPVTRMPLYDKNEKDR